MIRLWELSTLILMVTSIDNCTAQKLKPLSKPTKSEDLEPNFWIIANAYNTSTTCTSLNEPAIRIKTQIWNHYLHPSPNEAYHCFLHKILITHHYNYNQNTDYYDIHFKHDPDRGVAAASTCLNYYTQNNTQSAKNQVIYRSNGLGRKEDLKFNKGFTNETSIIDYLTINHYNRTWTIYDAIQEYQYRPLSLKVKSKRSKSARGDCDRNANIEYYEILMESTQITVNQNSKQIREHTKKTDTNCYWSDGACTTNMGFLLFDYPPDYKLKTKYCKLNYRTDTCELTQASLRCPNLELAYYSIEKENACENYLQYVRININNTYPKIQVANYTWPDMAMSFPMLFWKTKLETQMVLTIYPLELCKT